MSTTKTKNIKTQINPPKAKNKLNMSRPQAVYDDEYDFSVQHSKSNHRNGEYKSLTVGAKKSVTLTNKGVTSNIGDDEYYEGEEYYEEEVPVPSTEKQTSDTNKKTESSS